MSKDKDKVSRFMHFTGKARAFFGPAERSSLDHEMTPENQALLIQQQEQGKQWETFIDANGTPYIVERK